MICPPSCRRGGQAHVSSARGRRAGISVRPVRFPRPSAAKRHGGAKRKIPLCAAVRRCCLFFNEMRFQIFYLERTLPPDDLAGSFAQSLPYCSSSTGSSHSLPVFSPGTSTAMCENQLSFLAPCQCLTSGGITTTSPGLSERAGLPHS